MQINSSICNTTCPLGQFGDVTTYTCQICEFPCATCKYVLDYCITCVILPDLPLFIFNAKCVPECSSGYWVTTLEGI